MLKNHWYASPKVETAKLVAATVTRIDEDQAYRATMNLRNLRAYTNLGIMGLGSSGYADTDATSADQVLNLNVSEAIVDTLRALVGAHKPRVRFLTSGGDYEAQAKAKNLNRFISGQFYANRIYEQDQTVFTCAAAMGTGFYLVDEDSKDVKIEWVFSDDVLVDDVEAKYGSPRNLYVVRDVERSVLIEKYPQFATELEQATQLRKDHVGSTKQADPVSLVECWHLAVNGKGGRHFLGTDVTTFVDEDYSDDVFPVVEFCYQKRVLGFFGKSVCEIVRGLQTEINTLLGKIQRLMNLASSKVFVAKGSKVAKAQMNNEEWGLVEYAGNQIPVLATVAAVAPEYYQQLDRLYQRAFEITGVSMGAVVGTRPAGLESGAALRENNDIQTQRFLHLGQAWEDFHIRVADRVLRAAKRLAKQKPSYSVVAEDGKQLFEIKWSDVDPGKDKFLMKAWPASLLPESPAGKMEVVQTMLGVEPRLQPYALQLLDNPDIEAALKRINAPTLVMDKIIERILSKGEMLPPEPFMDLEMGIVQMQQAYLAAIVDDIPEVNLSLMRQWMIDAQEIIATSAAAIPPPSEQAMMPGPQGGGEQMPPMPGPMPGPMGPQG